MTRHICCGDVVAGCKFEAQAESEGELMKKVAEHAAAVHGVDKVGPELAAKVKAAIRTR